MVAVLVAECTVKSVVPIVYSIELGLHYVLHSVHNMLQKYSNLAVRKPSPYCIAYTILKRLIRLLQVAKSSLDDCLWALIKQKIALLGEMVST